jgi:hypothetical protein
MYRSVDWAALTDEQRRIFEELGLEPGQRVYIRKLNKLSDDALAAAVRQHDEQAAKTSNLTDDLKKKFLRKQRTIARRLRQLREAGRLATGTNNTGGVAA